MGIPEFAQRFRIQASRRKIIKEGVKLMQKKKKSSSGVMAIVLWVLWVALWTVLFNELDAEVKGNSLKTEVAPVQPHRAEYYPATADELAEEDYWNQMELLAVCVEAEAGNQGLEGKRLVVDVILNRVDDKTGEWPDTIEGVISQKNHFASYWDGGMERVIEPSEETLKAVRMEVEERSYPGLYYFREGTWSAYGTPWRKVGDHYFSTK